MRQERAWTVKCKEKVGIAMGRFIPLSVPTMGGNEMKYTNNAVEKAWVSSGGSYVTEFESSIAAFLHAEDVAACQSGTSALHLSLIECGVGSGDAVIVPALTFIATVNPVRYQHAEPVFMDCDDSLCMDPAKLMEFCKDICKYEDGMLTYQGKHVKAVIVAHIFGNMADMEAIMDIAGKYSLKVIEDAAEALGTLYTSGQFAGKYAGTIGDFGAFSFNGNKIITTGGGGAVTAKKLKSVGHIRYLSTQAKDSPDCYVHHEVGYNYRMTNLQAAIGVAQMEQLEYFIQCKRKNYKKYAELFDGFRLCRIMPFRQGTQSNMWFYSLEIDTENIKVPIDAVIEELAKKGVQARAIWGLIHKQKPYVNDTAYKIERASFYAGRIINIPSSTGITYEDIQYVAGCVKKILSSFAGS